MNNKKVLVVGSNGLLGSTLVELLKAKGFAVATSDISDDNGIDITNKQSVEAKLAETSPDFVINCAAYTNVEASEDEFPLAQKINAFGPKNLVEACLAKNIGLVHISTDYVFGENLEAGYTENHQPYSPLNKYGQSKVEGEEAIIAALGGLTGSDFATQSPAVYIVRTAALFGKGATNFIAKILQFAQEKEYLEVVTDEVVCPTYVKDLSENIISLIETEAKPGVYHVTGAGSCTRKEFAEEILRLAGIATPVRPTTLSKFNRKAKIPNISILLNTKLPEMRKWQEMLAEYMNGMRNEKFGIKGM